MLEKIGIKRISSVAGGNVICTAWENNLSFLCKAEHSYTPQPRNSTPKHRPSCCPHIPAEDMNKNVHSSPIHNSQTSTIRGGDKFVAVQSDNGILYCSKWPSYRSNSMCELQLYEAEWGKKNQIPEKHIQYNLFSTKFKNKHPNNILLRHTYILNKT